MGISMSRSDSMESKLMESKLMESKLMESKLMESKLMESKLMESKLMESKLMESKLMESVKSKSIAIQSQLQSKPELKFAPMNYQEELTCPISRELFNEPVLADDGFFYEKNEIEKWLKTKMTSPRSE